MQNLNNLLESYALNSTPFVISHVLAANTAESIAVPNGARYVLLSGTNDFWVNTRTTAVVPAADIDTGLSPFYIPGGYKEIRKIADVRTISVISTPASIVTAEFYK